MTTAHDKYARLKAILEQRQRPDPRRRVTRGSTTLWLDEYGEVWMASCRLESGDMLRWRASA